MRTFYPAIEPYNSGFLAVSPVHRIYYEECGNPQGQPALVLHGGPGAGCMPQMRQLFDPEHYRIVLFDQRGSGRSLPESSLEENTTGHLVEDIEKLRAHLKIEQWLVLGGSWGVTLGLAYAQSYPTQVTHLVLRGTFLARQQDIIWLYHYGASEIFPERWQVFLNGIKASVGENYLHAYYKALTGNDEQAKLHAGRGWCNWEYSIVRMIMQEPPFEDKFMIQSARIASHYMVNNCFLRENQLIEDAFKIQQIPTTIIHGRYDVICTMSNAYDLHQALPHANLMVCPLSGHSTLENEIVAALIQATDHYRN